MTPAETAYLAYVIIAFTVWGVTLAFLSHRETRK